MNDTIVSPATPLFPSAIGLVRLSGPRCKEIVAKLTKRNNFRNRFAHLVEIYDDDGKIIDEGILIFYEKPSSYTGEDMAEISLHGNPVIINHVVSLCIKNGARMAQEGEFTKRAFLNGKITLEKAESILSVVNSSTLEGVKASIRILKGEFQNVIEKIRSKIIDIISDIQASLDFPEDVDTEITKDKIQQNVYETLNDLEKIYSSWKSSRMMIEGATCTIIGKPNAGKSSLFNLLVGESRAIISPFPGTTRDYIDARIDVGGGVLIKLIDTAGIRQTPDPVEKEGIKRAIELSSESDVILCVFDSSSEFDNDDKKSIEISLSSKAEILIFIINKSDIGDVSKYERILEGFKQHGKDLKILSISCLKNENIDRLKETIKDFVVKGKDQDFFALSSRQIGLISLVMEKLKTSLEFISASDYLGSVIEIKEALSNIDDLFGKGSSPEVIDNIFKKFCIGK